jgi:hypothetical protein
MTQGQTVQGTTTRTMIIDSGASDNFVEIHQRVRNRRKAPYPIHIKMPDGNVITSDEIGDLDIPNLPPKACIARMCQHLDGCSLLSVGILCDLGMDVIFTAADVKVWHNKRLVLYGTRNGPRDMWRVDLDQPLPDNETFTPPEAPFDHPCVLHHIAAMPIAELVAFAHQCLGSPTIHAMDKAIKKGFLHNFPGLTLRRFRKYPPRTMATAKGHMDQTRQQTTHITKKAKASPTDNVNDDATNEHTPYEPDDTDCTIPEQITERTHFCYFTIVDRQMFENMHGKIYTDPTGRFPHMSSSGNQYIMVCYAYDFNAIIVEPYKTKSAPCIRVTNAMDAIYTRLQRK